jgi:CheY-like chemotaxis protein
MAKQPEPVQDYFSFLDRTVNILLVDDQPELLDSFAQLLSDVRVYNVRVAGSAKDAKAILDRDMVHLCLLDLGIRDIKGDEFYLPRTYGEHTRFFVLTGSTSPEQGAAAVMSGATGVFDKPALFDAHAPRINEQILRHIVTPRPRSAVTAALNHSVNFLLQKAPANVGDWASGANVSYDALHDLWNGRGLKPATVLFMYSVYRDALAYHMRRLRLEKNGAEALPCPVEKHAKYREQFLTKRTEYLRLLGHASPG